MAGVTLIGLLNQVTDQFSSKRALSVSGKFDLTYSRIHELVERAASRLVASGINTGDVVALTFPNTVEVRLFFILFIFVISLYLFNLIIQSSSNRQTHVTCRSYLLQY